MRRQAMAVAVLGCALVAAGCTGSDPSPGNTTTSTSTTTAAPTTTTSPPSPTGTMTSAAALPSDLPPLARQHSRAGAIAMAKYFLDAADKAFMSNDGATLRAISVKSCIGCQNMIDGISRAKARGVHQNGPSIHIAGTVASPTPNDSAPTQNVDVRIDGLAAESVDPSGKVVQKQQARKYTARVVTMWTKDGWRVAAAGELNE